MRLSEFDFHLPDHLIATRPANPRTSARLLLAQDGGIGDHTVSDLPQFLRPGDRLVLNNTRVIPARLFGMRTRNTPQGDVTAKVELTLLSPTGTGEWNVLAKPLRKLQIGDVIHIPPTLSATVTNKSDTQAVIRFNTNGQDLDDLLDQSGQMPLPPYIAAKRAADAQDKTDYQTVFAQVKGAVAAPTASLHFDQGLLDQITNMGVNITHVTLHVGAGTFLPVKHDDVSKHKMHAEWGQVSDQAAREIRETRANGGRVIPVGTTALRLIETAAQGGKITPWEGETDIFIRPGFQFQITGALMTNFHLPKSTLMMLVAALMGKDQIDQIYAHAIAQNYRFFSYGDSSLLVPNRK